MGYRLEDLIRGSMRGGLIFGYAPATADHRSPRAYRDALIAEMSRVRDAGLVSETCLSSDLEVLDEARRALGVTLCGLIPDRISADELERLLRCVICEDRAYFTRRFRNDPTMHRRKPATLTSQQRASLFELFPEVHQDFVLLITHEPRIAELLRRSSQPSSPLFDYRHHYRMLELS